MATPKTLKEITEEKAKSIIGKHPEGRWEGIPFVNGDFVYEGRATKWGRRYEMIRVLNYCGRGSYEHGVVSC